MAWLCASLLVTAGCSGGHLRPEHEPRLSLVETDPQGASVFIDGGFVGQTPASFHLPDKKRVEIRIELPGFLPVEDVLIRHLGTPEGAPAGVGWEEVYYYPLTRKG